MNAAVALLRHDASPPPCEGPVVPSLRGAAGTAGGRRRHRGLVQPRGASPRSLRAGGCIHAMAAPRPAKSRRRVERRPRAAAPLMCYMAAPMAAGEPG